MTSALAMYGGALRRDCIRLWLLDTSGRPLRHVDTGAWHRLRPGDRAFLERCGGPTLDVGCGPGRLVQALHAAGVPALGIDICPTAVRLARRRGARAVSADVFGPVPGAGGWRHALLADGNIGIGGDPARLLRRCASLLHGDGRLLVEADPPGSGGWTGAAVLYDGTRASRPFPWAFVAADQLERYAAAAGLRVLESWNEDGRWFACLTR
jgi:SAM-dependent methyltransferase